MANDILPAALIKSEPLADALAQRYLAYALAAITDRALPDVRDGLKPVHRRLLFAMSTLRLNANTPHKKCARVVGDVIGKYHPHGDQAVYDALARLAQDFSVRYPLIDGQGNFGNVDGDSPAAMRYTEARLTTVAEAVLDDVTDDVVPYKPNYDDSEREPEVLPAAFPQLLANGASGIAVGMATEIPPHNLDELAGALQHLLAHPNCTTNDLLHYIQGPDFPGGGLLCETRESMLDTYETGRGGFKVRAKIEREDTGRGGYVLVATQIPYRVQKSRLIERIANFIADKKLPLLEDIRDESDENIRIVFEPKSRSVDPEQLLASLYRPGTELEVRLPMNMTVLDAQRIPRQLGLKAVLQAYLVHRRHMLLNRSNARLQRIAERLHILDGLLIVFVNLDVVIGIIRNSDQPKADLCAQLQLSDTQAEAVLNLRLRALAKLEELTIRTEHSALCAEQAELTQIVNSPEAQSAKLQLQLKHMQKQFGAKSVYGPRRTKVVGMVKAVSVIIPVVREPITLVCSVKERLRAFKGHATRPDDVKHKDNDSTRFMLATHTDDKVAVFASGGKVFTLPCDKLPDGRGLGDPLRLFAPVPDGQEIVAMLSQQQTPTPVVVLTTDGYGFLLPIAEAEAATRAGKQVTRPDSTLFAVLPATGDKIAFINSKNRLLVVDMSVLPTMARGKGMQLMHCKEATLQHAIVFNYADGLLLPNSAEPLRDAALKPFCGLRGTQGKPMLGVARLL